MKTDNKIFKYTFLGCLVVIAVTLFASAIMGYSAEEYSYVKQNQTESYTYSNGTRTIHVSKDVIDSGYNTLAYHTSGFFYAVQNAVLSTTSSAFGDRYLGGTYTRWNTNGTGRFDGILKPGSYEYIWYSSVVMDHGTLVNGWYEIVPKVYDSTIRQYIAIAGSVNNGIVLDMSDMGEDALEFDITISGKRPTIQYMNAFKELFEVVPSGRPISMITPESIKSWLLEYDGHLAYNSYKFNSLHIFSKQYNLTPSYGTSYDLIFTATGTLQDGYIVITPTYEQWLTYNRNVGGIYTPSVENEPYYFGLSTINTIVITPKVGNRIGKTTYSKFDNDGNLTTYYSINGLLTDVTQDTINDTYVEASQTQIENLQKEINELKAQYNDNIKEYIANQLDISTDDTGILGGFSDILSTIGGLTASVGGISAMFALFFSCLPSFVLQIISFTIVSLCIISIYKALRG